MMRKTAPTFGLTVALTTLTFSLALATSVVAAPAGSDVPPNLVVDVHLFEMRSRSPNFEAMAALSFFIDSDGSGVTEVQWLGTIARQVPDAFLATLAFETVPVEGTSADFVFQTRRRSLALQVDMSGYLAQGTYTGTMTGGLKRGDEVLRDFPGRELELRSGQTFVTSSAELELSASEYLSHFRDYENNEHRGQVYEYLRDYTVFLIVALTPRLADDARPERADITLPEDVELPELDSPSSIRLVGTIELDFDVDAGGVPHDIRIARSSIPEVNPRIVGAAETWRYPDSVVGPVRLKLDLQAEP